jgi:predicted phosphodiesterase
MKLGLITDIHEQVEFLQIARDHFRQEQVDRFVVIGDVFETGERIAETCHLLAEARAIGAWGNHDYGLCCNPPDEIRVRFSASIIGFMKSLRPRLEIEDCTSCPRENTSTLKLWRQPPSDGPRNSRFDVGIV